MPLAAQPSDTIFSTAQLARLEKDLGRYRLQQRGDLYEQGGWWKLRWREDQVKADGAIKYGWSRPVVIGRAGRGEMTETEARRIAWENHLSRLDSNNRTPQSIMTVAEYVAYRFLPGHVDSLKLSARIHYRNMLAHVLPALGARRLRDVTMHEVQLLVSKMLDSKWRRVKKVKGKLIEFGPATPYSAATARHVKNCVSAIFTHAERNGCYSGTNPAKHAVVRAADSKELHALTVEQLNDLLPRLKESTREIVLFASLTGMNIAEICGLQWKRVNLSGDPATIDGVPLPGQSLYVNRQWYRNQWGSVKRDARRRKIALPRLLVDVLTRVRLRSAYRGPDDPVFCSSTGHPVDAHNIANRELRVIGKAAGMPWLSWHVFRRTLATIADETGMTSGDRQSTLGHADPAMTVHYTEKAMERKRAVMDEMAEKLRRAAMPAAKLKRVK